MSNIVFFQANVIRTNRIAAFVAFYSTSSLPVERESLAAACLRLSASGALNPVKQSKPKAGFGRIWIGF